MAEKKRRKVSPKKSTGTVGKKAAKKAAKASKERRSRETRVDQRAASKIGTKRNKRAKVREIKTFGVRGR